MFQTRLIIINIDIYFINDNNNNFLFQIRVFISVINNSIYLLFNNNSLFQTQVRVVPKGGGEPEAATEAAGDG